MMTLVVRQTLHWGLSLRKCLPGITFVFLCAIVISECNHGNEKGKIVIAGLFPVSDNVPEATIGRGVKPAVELAIKMINERSDLLPNHYLDIVDNDTKVHMYLY